MRCAAAVVMTAVAASVVMASAAVTDAATTVPATTFAQLAENAVGTVLRTWYAGGSAFCAGASNSDWGADSMIDVLYLRWKLGRDPVVARAFAAIAAGEPVPALGRFSDVPMWDAVAALRAYDVTRDPRALANAERQYRGLVTSRRFALGPCRALDYQIRDAGGGGLKTLETDANRILAAVLLSRRTHERGLARAALADARRTYAAVRATFLDARLPLYTAYVFPAGGIRAGGIGAGGRCVQEPARQFFASVNGRMIEAGLALAAATGQPRYAAEARATARAVERRLADARGIFAGLQAQNDVVAPLVVAMAALARGGDAGAGGGDADARGWIVRNAAAAANARGADGSYGRFFDGPAPPAGGRVSVYEASGGLALMVAAGALAPERRPEADAWRRAAVRAVSIGRAPAAYRFTGSGIAFVGALPEAGSPDCRPLTVGRCEGGHVGLRIDGRAMVNRIGIWQGKALVSSPATVLFAWRWPASGPHEIAFDPVPFNAKQGGTEIHLTRALVLP
jgi:hypothetical protein